MKQNPAEQANPDPQPPSRSESDSETAEPPAENPGSSEGGGGSGGSAPLLTEQAAEDLLTQQFMQEGRHVQLLSLGLDTEETHWRFSVRTEDGTFLAVFSVSRTDGSIHKMPTN